MSKLPVPTKYLEQQNKLYSQCGNAIRFDKITRMDNLVGIV